MLLMILSQFSQTFHLRAWKCGISQALQCWGWVRSHIGTIQGSSRTAAEDAQGTKWCLGLNWGWAYERHFWALSVPCCSFWTEFRLSCGFSPLIFLYGHNPSFSRYFWGWHTYWGLTHMFREGTLAQCQLVQGSSCKSRARQKSFL